MCAGLPSGRCMEEGSAGSSYILQWYRHVFKVSANVTGMVDARLTRWRTVLL